MVKYCMMDLEANGLDPTEVHCIAVKTEEMDKPILLDPDLFIRWVELNKPERWFIHNGLGYDCWVANKLIKRGLINPLKVVDTLVVSKLVNYEKFQTHSLKELGEHLGVYKGDYTGGWDTYSSEMGEYCIQDVVVLEAIVWYYQKQIYDPSWAKAMRLEHDTAIICNDIHYNGMYFNKSLAEETLKEIETDLKTIEDQMQEDFPPKLEEAKRIKLRKKKDGSLYSNVTQAKETYPLVKEDGEELVCYDYETFNPGSPKMRIDRLWEAGWKPVEKTKGHKKWLREQKPSRFFGTIQKNR